VEYVGNNNIVNILTQILMFFEILLIQYIAMDNFNFPYF